MLGTISVALIARDFGSGRCDFHVWNADTDGVLA